MNLSLEGRNAIVCGSSQGIGFAIAVELAIMGANCILLARNEDNLKTAVAQLDISIPVVQRPGLLLMPRKKNFSRLLTSIWSLIISLPTLLSRE